MTTFQKIRIKKCQMDKLTVDNRGRYNKEMVWYVTIKVLEIKKKKPLTRSSCHCQKFVVNKNTKGHGE